jgi:hypothetical protein
MFFLKADSLPYEDQRVYEKHCHGTKAKPDPWYPKGVVIAHINRFKGDLYLL